MPVTVLARRRIHGLRARPLGDFVERALKHLGQASAEVCVSLVSDAEIQALNRQYRHKDRPTDVLAFPVREGERIPGDEQHLGDVVISVDTARRQAEEHGRSLEEELATLLIHGLLHLLGYDHERSPAEARKMRQLERRLAATVGPLRLRGEFLT
jgi:rRNA maturation RNase YbeY